MVLIKTSVEEIQHNPIAVNSETKKEILTPREYQEEDIKAINDLWNNGIKNVMLQSPTGSGKTPTCVKISENHINKFPDSKVVILTGNYEDNDQFRFDFARFTDLSVYNGMATIWPNREKVHFPKENVIVTSPQVLWSRLKCDNTNTLNDYFNYYDLLIVNEAHHSVAPTWERVVSNFPGLVLGVTATPWRMNKDVGFDHIYEELHCSWSIKKLIDHGYLAYVNWDSPGEDRRMKSEGARLAPNGDYLIQDLLKFNPKAVRTDNAVNYWEKQAVTYINGQINIRKTIFYALSSEHAIELHQELTRKGYKGRVLLSKRDPVYSLKEVREQRRNTVNMFRNGVIDYIVNVFIISEGFNCPDADCIVILRNTLSVALYLQMAGRGMRPSHKYEDALIIDMTASWMKIGYILQDREWSLLPRAETEPGNGVFKTCPVGNCGVECAVSYHNCPACGYAFGWDCPGCKWRSRDAWFTEPTILEIIRGGNRCQFCKAGAQMPVMYRFGKNQHLSNTLLYLYLEQNDDGWTARWYSNEHGRNFHVAFFQNNMGYWMSMPGDDEWQNCCTVITNELSNNQINELHNIGALASLRQWGFLTEAQRAIIDIEGIENLQNNEPYDPTFTTSFIINRESFNKRWRVSGRNPNIYLNSTPELGIKVWINKVDDELYKWGVYTEDKERKDVVSNINAISESYTTIEDAKEKIYSEMTNYAMMNLL